MNPTSSSLESREFVELQKQAFVSFANAEYSEAINLYEQLISLDSTNKVNYWYLGLSQLLQGEEENAQMTWMLAIEDAEIDEIDLWTDELIQILEKEAQNQENLGLEQSAITIRYHLRELNPYSINNLISIVLLSIKLKTFTSIDLIDLSIIDLLKSQEFIPLSQEVVLKTLENVLTLIPSDEIIIQFVENLCLSHINYKSAITDKFLALGRSMLSNATDANILFAIQILETGLHIDSKSIEIMMYLTELYIVIQNYAKSIEIARNLYHVAFDSSKNIDKVLACQWLIRSLITKCTNWEEAQKVHQEFENSLRDLVQENPLDLSLRQVAFYLVVTGYYAPYFSDSPRETHILRREVRQLAYARINATEQERIDGYRKRQILRKNSFFANRPLRIGYLSSSLRRHSVGYLSRWLLQYHDRQQFELYGYLIDYRASDPMQLWFEKQFYKVYKELSGSPIDIATQINQDGIDILIDLDSITSATCSSILTFKPAPIQVTWLGWDAAGQSTVDYFIADPYVLPESAQEYYAEKIWRLPHTYIAVDGFEVSAPTIRRSSLDIPNNAVIYLSAQSAMKRHPICIRMQMKIIKLVPNSYLLIKSLIGEQESLREFFHQIAETEGVSTEQLRFLPFTSGEEEHRANLGIADVVLDTYPYNGATHTMETLWMGIPIVTRVGEQFAARNSYTMMVNAGISEGIAWTDDEYIEWGIKLGTDIDLRQKVAWKLKQGRQTEPLWDSRQFTHDMETAYKQMWEKYLESDDQEIELDSEGDRALFIAEAEIQNAQGISFAQQGKLDLAISSFQTAISLDANLADAYYNLGIALSETGDIDQALLNFQTTVKLNPNHANGLYNLGLTLVKFGKIDQAIASYYQTLAILPNDIQTHHALGNAFFAQSKWSDAINSYQFALSIDPNLVDVISSMGAALTEQGKFQESISYLQSAIKLDPNNAEAYCNLGHVFSRTKQIAEAVNCYGKAIELKPDLASAYWNFNNDILANGDNPLHHNYKLRRQLADQFVESCGKTEKVRASVNFITNYTQSGLSDQAKSILMDLENYVFQNSDHLTDIEIEVLYNNLLFIVSSIRDDARLNTYLCKFIGRIYTDKIIKSKINRDLEMNKFYDHLKASQDSQIRESLKISPLRIGILSPHFARHPVSWCSFDVIRELSYLTPHIYLYATDEIKTDDRTRLFEEVAEKFYWYESSKLNPHENTFSARLDRLIIDISNDKLDILIDLDSLTKSINTHIIYRKLAPVCISWLGFDAPFVSANNYWLCDWYTHPSTVDADYIEQLIRLPDSHMAISGFDYVPIDRDQQREYLGISSNQIAYLFAAPGRKFNKDTAKACIQIIKQVPDSILLHKGNGDLEVIQSTYKELCDAQGVDYQRVKFLPSYKTEEEHRSIYLIADIYLDSYPYNGGSHNLEALWFNLPVVTRCGEQSFARMGASFIQAAGINEGIVSSWEDYVSKGVKFGLDVGLRNLIKEQLILSKQPEHLAPLWNPKKLAVDMYNLLYELFNKRQSR